MTEINRQAMDVDIVCVGFGPATAGFLTTISKHLLNEDGTTKLESKVMPGMPMQIMCYERADDLGFGVSGVVTKARAIKKTFPDLNISEIPLAANIKKEKLLYLFDPIGASKRSLGVRISDSILKLFKWLPFYRDHAFDIPFIPGFLQKHNGLILSIGQFSQWVGSQVMATGMVQIWPGTPANEPLIEDDKVLGVRLMDQGTDKQGNPDAGFMPGMDIKSQLTVVGDGPVGAIGQKLNEKFGLPEGHEQKDWAVGAKMLINLREDIDIEPGTVIHTIGYPEPEIFGFMYIMPDRVASVGIFVPSWFDNPGKNSYRYLQHWLMHPAIWKYVQGGTMRSWGAKSLLEAGKHGEPYLVGHGFARIGEGSGTTNTLTNSGVDEAWMSGALLAESVVELAEQNKPFSKENLQAGYVKRREESWLGKEAKIADRSRDGFQKGFIKGLLATAIAGFTKGLIKLSNKPKATHERLPSLVDYYQKKLTSTDIHKIKENAYSKGLASYDDFMTKSGWPEIPYDGKLLVSHQDALLMGGKVQANPGYKDHVSFIEPELCRTCDNKVCIEMCSGQAIAPGDNGVPNFDREKCVHCGACHWNCTKTLQANTKENNVSFDAGVGGFHSAEN